MVDGEGSLVSGPLTKRILGCAIEVHRDLGPGLLESAYRACFVDRLERDGLVSEAGSPRGAELHPIHGAQIRTYLKFLDLRVGLLMNFNVIHLMSGVRRYVL